MDIIVFIRENLNSEVIRDLNISPNDLDVAQSRQELRESVSFFKSEISNLKAQIEDFERALCDKKLLSQSTESDKELLSQPTESDESDKELSSYVAREDLSLGDP